MKKRMLLAAGAVLVAATVSAFVYVKNESNSMDGLFNANVEALADTENGKGEWYVNHGDGWVICTPYGEDNC